jgi:hypothetical protein
MRRPPRGNHLQYHPAGPIAVRGAQTLWLLWRRHLSLPLDQEGLGGVILPVATHGNRAANPPPPRPPPSREGAMRRMRLPRSSPGMTRLCRLFRLSQSQSSTASMPRHREGATLWHRQGLIESDRRPQVLIQLAGMPARRRRSDNARLIPGGSFDDWAPRSGGTGGRGAAPTTAGRQRRKN